MNDNRRRHRRIIAPVQWQLADLTSLLNPLVNIGLGGMRVYSDRPLKIGQCLEIELFLPDNTRLVCNAEVRWLRSVTGDQSANYDVGLKFLHISEEDLLRLADFLEKQA
jgi:c-di-GMP-binding flagellar brake protein YcgR